MKHLTIDDNPTRRVVRARVPHGVNSQLVISLNYDGTFTIKEHRRRKFFRFDAAKLYVREIEKEAAQPKRRKR